MIFNIGLTYGISSMDYHVSKDPPCLGQLLDLTKQKGTEQRILALRQELNPHAVTRAARDPPRTITLLSSKQRRGHSAGKKSGLPFSRPPPPPIRQGRAAGVPPKQLERRDVPWDKMPTVEGGGGVREGGEGKGEGGGPSGHHHIDCLPALIKN